MDEATLAQVRAADPGRSTWLTANAGSGKTRVLTDRVARLLLAGTAPEKILCLTYTKAAATEMQNRLLARLGKWAMLPEADLRAELARLVAIRTRIKAAQTQPLSEEQLAMAAAQAAERQFMDFTQETLR